jgi:hypothetical protein
MVRRGDPLRFSADLYNAVEEFFRQHPDLATGAGSIDPAQLREFDGFEPTFANQAGNALPPGSVVALADPMPTPANDLASFRQSPILKAFAPAAGDGSSGTGKRTVGVVIEGASYVENAAGVARIAGLAVARIIAGADVTANGAPKWVEVVPGDATACRPTSDPSAAFARVLYAPAVSQPTYAVVEMRAASSGGAKLKYARITSGSQQQPINANGYVGVVAALPIDAPNEAPANGATSIYLAVVSRRQVIYRYDPARMYLPENATVAYLDSPFDVLAGQGTVTVAGTVLSDHDERESEWLYFGKVKGVDNQGVIEPKTRDSGHFALPTEVQVDLLYREDGMVLSQTPWVLIPKAATRWIKQNDIIVFRHECGLRDGSNDWAVLERWGDSTWEQGKFIAINVGSVDDDCGQFGCGVAVGVDVPRTESTGILRMFRGKRPDLTKPMSATNRAPYELQFGVNTLGRWLGSQSGAKIGRITFPGLPYGNFREPAGGFPWWTKTDGTQMPNIFRTVYAGRHLVSRRLTGNKNGVHMDWSPPTYSGGLYLMSAGNDETYANGAMTNGNFNIMYLTVRDGLILGGVTSTGGNIPSGIYNFNRNTDAGAIHSLSDPDDWEMPLDTGCCPKYDAAGDVTQGP